MKLSCPCCGDVELPASKVRLVICSAKERSYYVFDCPQCSEEVRKPAGEDVVALLISGGVAVERWIIPAEATEDHAGRPITWDDVLDFALVVGEHEDLASLAGRDLRYLP